MGAGAALPSGVTGVYGSISVSSDGRTVLMGSNYEENIYAGAAYLWGRGAAGFPADEWVQLGDHLSYPAIQPLAMVGFALSISGDASQLAVAGQQLNTYTERNQVPCMCAAAARWHSVSHGVWCRLCVSPSCSVPYMDNMVGGVFAGYMRITCENCTPGFYW